MGRGSQWLRAAWTSASRLPPYASLLPGLPSAPPVSKPSAVIALCSFRQPSRDRPSFASRSAGVGDAIGCAAGAFAMGANGGGVLVCGAASEGGGVTVCGVSAGSFGSGDATATTAAGGNASGVLVGKGDSEGGDAAACSGSVGWLGSGIDAGLLICGANSEGWRGRLLLQFVLARLGRWWEGSHLMNRRGGGQYTMYNPAPIAARAMQQQHDRRTRTTTSANRWHFPGRASLYAKRLPFVRDAHQPLRVVGYSRRRCRRSSRRGGFRLRLER